MSRKILSLCDYSGNWPAPYAEAGYQVLLVDPKHKEARAERRSQQVAVYPGTVQQLLTKLPDDIQIHGVLAAPPCTHFSRSGAQYWKAKDADGRTQAGLEIVRACLEVVRRVQPVWWALENPVGRLPTLLPELGRPGMYFQPHHYGDPYTKLTGLWGRFNRELPRTDVEPIRYTKQGSWTQRYGGGSGEKGKEARSMTPMGFAKAFFLANP